MENTKEFVVASLNRKVDIIGLTEDQEQELIKMLVDFVDMATWDVDEPPSYVWVS